MSKQRREKSLHGNGAGAITPTSCGTFKKLQSTADIKVEEILFQSYMREKKRSERYLRERDDARAALKQYKAMGKVRHIAKQLFEKGKGK